MTSPSFSHSMPLERVKEMISEAGFFSHVDENGNLFATAVDPKTADFFAARFPVYKIASMDPEHQFILRSAAIRFLANAMKTAGEE